MLNQYWYLLSLAVIILFLSCWITFNNTRHVTVAERARYLKKLLVQFTISLGAYWILVFILSLVIAAALWLILLLLIWVPSDFFQNYLDSSVFTHALNGLKPILYRSSSSPGFTHVPMLDYISIYTAATVGPLCGIWSIWSQFQPKPTNNLEKPLAH